MSAEPPLQAHRVEAELEHDGTLTLDNLPFRAGQTVEVIILSRPSPTAPGQNPLRGSVLRYDRPFDPVADDDWEAAR